MNNGYSTALLKSVYHAIPEGAKPFAKQIYGFADLRTRAIASRRSVCQGHRVEFLDFEIAYLEPFEFLSPGPDEAMVKTHCTLVSPGTERAVLCGLPGVPRGLFPFPPGYSAVGTVQRVGRRLGQFREGQRVAGRLPHASAGIMSPASLFPVPAEVSDEEACFIELGIITLQGVRRGGIAPGTPRRGRRSGPHRPAGQSPGAGVGSRSSRRRGVEPHACRQRARERFGRRVPRTWPSSPPLGDIGADVVIEAVGSPGAVLTAMSCARDGGTVVLLGSSRGLGRNIDIFGAAQKRRITMVGAHISVAADQRRQPQSVHLRRGRAPVHRAAADQAARGGRPDHLARQSRGLQRGLRGAGPRRRPPCRHHVRLEELDCGVEMTPLKLGIVGAGGIAQRNATEAARSGAAEIAGVFDVNHIVARDHGARPESAVLFELRGAPRNAGPRGGAALGAPSPSSSHDRAGGPRGQARSGRKADRQHHGGGRGDDRRV